MIIEALAYAAGLLVAGLGVAGAAVRTLALAAGFAAVATYLLQPANALGFTWTFLDAAALESMASLLAWAAVRAGAHSAGARSASA